MEMTDIHAHILPGIDDGPETMEETRRMLRKAFEQGIRSIIFAGTMSRKSDRFMSWLAQFRLRPIP